MTARKTEYLLSEKKTKQNIQPSLFFAFSFPALKIECFFLGGGLFCVTTSSAAMTKMNVRICKTNVSQDEILADVP